jgi:hypothetical protein
MVAESSASRKGTFASCLQIAALQKKRFRSLQKRLQQDDALRTIYEEKMLDLVLKQLVELAPTTEDSTGVFYL